MESGFSVQPLSAGKLAGFSQTDNSKTIQHNAFELTPLNF